MFGYLNVVYKALTFCFHVFYSISFEFNMYLMSYFDAANGKANMKHFCF